MTDVGIPDDWQQCYVENREDRDYVLKFASRKFKLPAGSRHLVPKVVVSHWMGDPSVIDHPTDPNKQSRKTERERVAVKWGLATSAGPQDFERGDRHVTEAGTWTGFPDLAAFSFEEPEKELPTVIADPFGESFNPDDLKKADERAMKDQFSALQQQLAHLQGLMAQEGVAVEGPVVAPATGPLPPKVDEPEEEIDPDQGAVMDDSSPIS